MLKKKDFKDWARSLSSKMILSFYINVICSLDTILSQRTGFTVFVTYLFFVKISIVFFFCFAEKWNTTILL